MKILNRVLSYLIVFLLGCLLALTAVHYFRLPTTKLDQVEYLIEEYFIGEHDDTKMQDAAAAGMISSLGDRWSYYVPAAEYASLLEQQENAYVGIGITIQANEDGLGFDIIAVTENGPAKEAGLLVGDIITAADSQSAAGITADELRDIVRGKEGTAVHLSLLRDGTAMEVDVMRAQILTDVTAHQMLNDAIGLVTIYNFDSRCAEEAIAAIETLREQGAQALIFDVRNNPGGYAHELVALLDYLLPEGELFHTMDYAGEESVDVSDAAFLDMPMVVLCNEDSYSAAEFFAAALQEYGAGTIVGTPTCGKGYFQTTFQLMDGSAIGLSIGKYFTPQGKSLAGVGIQPDVLLDVDDETYAKIYYKTLDAQDDPQIQAAMEILNKQQSFD